MGKRIWSKSLDDPFWGRVDIRGPDECWPWMAGRHAAGYGCLIRSDNGKHDTAHRVAFELTNGPIPAGIHILHDCDYPPCCNPKHLLAGTSGDNMRDKERKGRGGHPVGEGNHSVLTRENVVEIRWLKATTGVSYVELGIMYGVTPVTIRNIVLCRKWKHVRMIRQSK